MGRSLKREIPGDDPRVSPEQIAELGWARLFAAARARVPTSNGPDRVAASSDTVVRRRVLEIGFGRGEFLLALASAAPEVDFVGIEVSWKRTLKLARKVARARRPNVLLTVARGEEALASAFEPGSLAEIWVNFSDPWPKLRHAGRRLIQPAFAALAARALAPGGTLWIATDDVPYAHQIDTVLAGEKALVNRYAPLAFLPAVAGRMTTGYEAQWLAEGRPLHFFAYSTRGGSVRGESARGEGAQG